MINDLSSITAGAGKSLMRKFTVLAVFSLFAAPQLLAASKQQPESSPTAKEAQLEPSQAELAAALSDSPKWLRKTYKNADYQYFWSDSDSDSESRERLLSFMDERIDANRLNPQDYNLESLRGAGALTRSQREIISAKVYAKLAQDLFDGRISPQIDIPDNYEPARDLSREKILARAYQHGDPMDYLMRQTPDNFLVEGLLVALKRYQKLQEAGGWDTVEMSESKLEVGDQSDAVPQIRARLRAEGYLDDHTTADNHTKRDLNQKEAGSKTYNPNLYTETDAAAVEKFQASRSILVDGIMGPGTLAAMNESLADLLNRLHVNIERARWLPSKLGERSVMVNIADYQVRMYRGETLVDSMKIIVGKDQTKTPVFADTMERVVVNPYWNIPNSIVCCEIAPQVLKNPEYLKEKNMEVLSGWGVDAPVIDESTVDWEAATRGEIDFRVRQKPGPTNALGLIKFLFPNEYAVYLHDTPADSLFERDKRAFSHGCIRLEKPVRFADFVMQEQSGWNGDKIAQQIESRERLVIELDEEIPVYIGYFTAWIDPQGNVSFARDIYQRDGRVATGLGL